MAETNIVGNEAIKNIVQHISFSDFKNDRPPPSGSSSSSIVATSASLTRARPESIENADEHLIDGKPFFINQKTIKEHAQRAISKAWDKNIDIGQVVEADRQFHSRGEMNRRQRGVPVKKKEEPVVVESDSSCSEGRNTIGAGSKSSRRHRKGHHRRQHFVKGMSGFMFGPIQKPVGPDPLTVDADKFGVPLTLINRVAKAQRKRRIREGYLRRIRFAHMGYIQPPDRDESSDNESMENVKKLALLRTPYFVIPTVKISQVRRKDRFRNKFLRKDRLKRINLLLSDRRYRGGSDDDSECDDGRDVDGGDDAAGDASAEEVEKTADMQKQHFFAKFFELDPKKKVASNRAPEKQKFYELIASKYEEHRKKCEPLEKVHHMQK